MKLKIKQWLLKKISNLIYDLGYRKNKDKLYFLVGEKELIEQFMKDLKDIDFHKALKNLTRGLDKKSSKVVYTILQRIFCVHENPLRFHDFFTKEELQEHDKFAKYCYNLKYNNQFFFKDYVFPIDSRPDRTSLYFKCHLNSLEANTIDRMGGGGVV